MWFQVCNIELKDLKASVELVLPMQCEARGCEITEEAMKTLLEVTEYKVPLQDLHVVYEESGEFDQTALALEHLRWDCMWSLLCPMYLKIKMEIVTPWCCLSMPRFFYKHIWREWDEEEEDDDFDYFVRCVEPRLRLWVQQMSQWLSVYVTKYRTKGKLPVYDLSYYDILEERVPAGLVAEYQSLLEECSRCFQQFSALCSTLSTDSDSELDNVSMVEGLKLSDQLEMLTRKLHIIENPLLR